MPLPLLIVALRESGTRRLYIGQWLAVLPASNQIHFIFAGNVCIFSIYKCIWSVLLVEENSQPREMHRDTTSTLHRYVHNQKIWKQTNLDILRKNVTTNATITCTIWFSAPDDMDQAQCYVTCIQNRYLHFYSSAFSMFAPSVVSNMYNNCTKRDNCLLLTDNQYHLLLYR
jgi:hypothetical protein